MCFFCQNTKVFDFFIHARVKVDLSSLRPAPEPFAVEQAPCSNQTFYVRKPSGEWIAQICSDSIHIGERLSRENLYKLIHILSVVIGKPLSIDDFRGSIYTTELCFLPVGVDDHEFLRKVFPGYEIEKKEVDGTLVLRASDHSVHLDDFVAIYDTDCKTLEEYMDVWGPKASEIAMKLVLAIKEETQNLYKELEKNAVPGNRYGFTFQMEDGYSDTQQFGRAFRMIAMKLLPPEAGIPRKQVPSHEQWEAGVTRPGVAIPFDENHPRYLGQIIAGPSIKKHPRYIGKTVKEPPGYDIHFTPC